jgi:hypothetical protein
MKRDDISEDLIHFIKGESLAWQMADADAWQMIEVFPWTAQVIKRIGG